MKCPRCEERLPSILCRECNEEILEKSRFCSWCGRPVATVTEVEGGDFSSRILCSDGNCIGVVNEQGVCNVCGKPFTKEAPGA